MVLGGLKEGVTPLEWTYAYSTIGNNGDRVSGTLAPRPGDSPVAYTQVTDQDGHTIKDGDNDSTHTQVIPRRRPPKKPRASSKPWSAAAPAPMPRSAPRASGARRARPRTTATPGSAVAVEDEVTACVWVGYADSTTPMKTLYNGGPVMGGTFPALIWARVISAWEEIRAERAAEESEPQDGKSARSGGIAKKHTCRPDRDLVEYAEAVEESAPETGSRAGTRSGRERSRAGTGEDPEAPPESGGGGVTAGLPNRAASEGAAVEPGGGAHHSGRVASIRKRCQRRRSARGARPPW